MPAVTKRSDACHIAPPGAVLDANGILLAVQNSATGPAHTLHLQRRVDRSGLSGGYWSYAFDINTSGQVAGHSSNTIGYSRAFLYSGGVIQDLGTLNGATADSYAYGLNDSAQVVGGSTYTNNTTTHAVRIDTLKIAGQIFTLKQKAKR